MRFLALTVTESLAGCQSSQSSQTPSAYSVLPGFPQPSSALSVAETSIRLSPRFAISVNRQLDHSATLVLSQFTSFVVNLGTSSLQVIIAKIVYPRTQLVFSVDSLHPAYRNFRQ
jgi:hypothetical protein